MMMASTDAEDDVQFLRTSDELVLRCCLAAPLQQKLCLAANGFGGRLGFLESTSNSKNVPADVSLCVFVLDRCVSVRALQEMLANHEDPHTGSAETDGHRTLLYGQALLLRHAHSDMYLSCLTSSGLSADKLAFDVGLQEDVAGETCWWTVHPASKQRSEGEKVRVGDDLIFISVSSERYLHVSWGTGVYDECINTSVDAAFQLTLWTVAPVSSLSTQAQGHLRGGDCLRLLHGHTDECLTVSPAGHAEDERRSVHFEGGCVSSQARSLWRIEMFRVSWSGSHIRWAESFRLYHVTTGKYLGLTPDRGLLLLDREHADVKSTAFCLRPSKESHSHQEFPLCVQKKDGMGTPEIKYGDSVCLVQHVDSGLWLSYQTSDSKRRKETEPSKQAILHSEGHMDDGLTLSRSQTEECKAASLIRSSTLLFTLFRRRLDELDHRANNPALDLPIETLRLSLCDLIGYFWLPDKRWSHEIRQSSSRALKNRQKLFQEEGVITLVLDCIDHLHLYSSAAHFAEAAGKEAGEAWEDILNSFYELLAALIRGNPYNCSQFSSSLDWLISRLDRLEASTGILEVLHCVLMESPEALNFIKEGHIRSIITLLDKHGRNHKILEVLSSLCVCHGTAVRSNQHLICDTLLPERDLLLQSRLVNHVTSVRPNIFLCMGDDSAQYRKWYYEVVVERVEPFVTPEPTHLRVGWACSTGYHPSLTGGHGWGSNGVGDDLRSYGFDGLHLWTGGVGRRVSSANQRLLREDDVISCCLDLSAACISFRVNGQPVQGMLENFNTDALMFPVVSFSAGVRVRVLLGAHHGEFKFLPPAGFSPCAEALLPRGRCRLELCEEVTRGHRNSQRELLGPAVSGDPVVFTPTPVDTNQVTLPPQFELIRERLAENLHEIWLLEKTESGWTHGPVRDDSKQLHPGLVEFSKLPDQERLSKLQAAEHTLRSLLALGAHIGLSDDHTEEKVKYVQISNKLELWNGYRAAPVDQSGVSLNTAQEALVEALAENQHNIWSREQIRQGWSYAPQQDIKGKRSPQLVPFTLLDERSRCCAKESVRDVLGTLLGFGYTVEASEQQCSLGSDVKAVSEERSRIFRVDHTFAVHDGKWYFEFEAVTDGEMRVGWARVGCQPDMELWSDEQAFVFDGSKGQWWHGSTVPFGHVWQKGDVIGCLLDLTRRTMMVTLNGELQLNAYGSEIASKGFSTAGGFVPVCGLSVNQVGRLNLGQQVDSLKHFSVCGLQEGYQPFALNMSKDPPLWMSWREPLFVQIPEDHPRLQVSYIDGTVGHLPALKVTQRSVGLPDSLSTDVEFYRLSLPIECAQVFSKPVDGAVPSASSVPCHIKEPEEGEDSDFEMLMKSAHRHTGSRDELNNHKDNVQEKPSRLKQRFLLKKKPELVTSGSSARLLEEVLAIERNSDKPLANCTKYYYSVKILHGQDPSCVWVGWVTSNFHCYDRSFDPERVCSVTITLGDQWGKVLESVKCSCCYMVCAAEGSSLSNGCSNVRLEIGCLVDTATGFLTFTANGKEIGIFYQVEPGTKLFPAVFAKATSSDVFQFELGRIKGALPLSAGLFRSEKKNMEPQCHPRLNVQSLIPTRWTRLPEHAPHVELTWLEERHGWRAQCVGSLQVMALHIPEEDRCIDILELSELDNLLMFHDHTLRLYSALCAHGNIPVSHALCSYIDQSQILFALRCSRLPGNLRAGFYDLLMTAYLSAPSSARQATTYEYIVPMTDAMRTITLFENNRNQPSLPGSSISTSLRPRMHFSLPCFVRASSNSFDNRSNKSEDGSCQYSPEFPLDVLKAIMADMLKEAVHSVGTNIRDPVGGNVELMLVPLLQLLHTLLLMGVYHHSDLRQVLFLIIPSAYIRENDARQLMDEGEENDIEQEEEEGRAIGEQKTLLQMKLPEAVKLQLCHLLQYLCDCQLRHRVEAIVTFSADLVGRLQSNQRSRYMDVMEALNMSAALTARKTKEFRSPPQEQMNMLLNFREKELDCPCPEKIRELLWDFHLDLRSHCGVETDEILVTEDDENQPIRNRLRNLVDKMSRLKRRLSGVVEEDVVAKPVSLQWLISDTVMHWAHKGPLEDPVLVRAAFGLLRCQYAGLAGKMAYALQKAYCITQNSVEDTLSLQEALGRIRSLLTARMGKEEVELMIQGLGDIMKNKVFYQHPNLMRALGMHETVMEVMVNVLGTRESKEIRFPKMVAHCCRFLCYFCRISRHNQKAMFEHLSYLLDHSSVGLASPSMRGSTPLDVAAASVMDNYELALALTESDLEKVVQYLAGCGLQSCTLLLSKGYADIGWNPVEGERYLDLLRFAVFCNGESVEENSYVVVRLLIRRPECFGPALRVEGGNGLLATMEEAIKLSEEESGECFSKAYQSSSTLDILDDEDDDVIHMGHAIMTFYSALIDLLGRCAPEMHLIEAGKGEAVRIRDILRSLIPLKDLEGVISIPFPLPFLDKDGCVMEPDMSRCFCPDHKASMVLFLDRVYGVQNQNFLLHLVEKGFLPDLQAAVSMDNSGLGGTDMALALNRYLCGSVLPLLSKCSSMLRDLPLVSTGTVDDFLQALYCLSKASSLTKAQHDAIQTCLLSVCGKLKPSQLQPLLRNLTVDVPQLSENTKMPLKLLTDHYKQNWKYYCTTGGRGGFGSASEEELRLSRKLFWRVFRSLTKKPYDAELFELSVGCLVAVSGAIPPNHIDLTCTSGLDSHSSLDSEGRFCPQPLDTSNVIVPEGLEHLVNKYAEHTHEKWSLEKFSNGWVYGEQMCESSKVHPLLKPYRALSERDKENYRVAIKETVKSMLVLGWIIERSKEGDARDLHHLSRRISQSPQLSFEGTSMFSPKPADTSSVTLTWDQYTMAEQLAENYHNIWAKRKLQELQAKAGGSHTLLVPYASLSGREQSRIRERAQDVLKFFHINGYTVWRERKPTESDPPSVSGRFAYRLLQQALCCTEHTQEKMLELEVAQARGQMGKSEKVCDEQQICFFVKVLLPLIDQYFKNHHLYFLPSLMFSLSNTAHASNKEREMVSSLFCKLAVLSRRRISLFGKDAQGVVSCLQILARSLDVKVAMKTSSGCVRSALDAFFEAAAVDLELAVDSVTLGVIQCRGDGEVLTYAITALIPVLTSLFRHTAHCQSSADLMVDEVQSSCYRILCSLYTLGTCSNTFVESQRSSVGECLSVLSAAFPVCFLEISLDYTRNAEREGVSAAAEDSSRPLPSLLEALSEVEDVLEAESAARHTLLSRVMEVTVPLLCSYMCRWGEEDRQGSEGKHRVSCSSLTPSHTNALLGQILAIIHVHMGRHECSWMKRIAMFVQPLVRKAEPGLLTSHFLPLMEKLKKRVESVVQEEERMYVAEMELIVQEKFAILVQDIYAFYPLLILFVERHRILWLRQMSADAERLFSLVAGVFTFWAKSHNFKWEEQNFVVQNDINNTTYLVNSGNSQTAKRACEEERRKVKRSKDERYSAHTSLIVASLKKLLSIGLNRCCRGDRGLQIVTLAKNRFSEKDTEEEVRAFVCSNLQQELSHSFLDEGHVESVLAVARVLFYLDQVESPQGSKRAVWQKLLSKQRKRAVVACFRMTPLYNLPRHRAVNFFLQSYRRLWVEPEDHLYEQKLIEDLSKAGDGGSVVEEEEEEERSEGTAEGKKIDPLHQLITLFHQSALTEKRLEEDSLYWSYTDIMAKSCQAEDEDGHDEVKSFEEKELEKQRLLYQQARLHDRGAAEMVLQRLSASRGVAGPWVEATLKLGIAILNGGNTDVQQKMLDYLREKRDVGFFHSLASLMQSCSVLDLNAFERQMKAEGLGTGAEGKAGDKVMAEEPLTCDLFRFLQLLCEGHNADFQNYLRSQTGNNTTVNIIISTVDYLLRLQESISDFYWYYSGKEVIDEHGQCNFSKAIRVAKQVFNTLTEYIQGPCTGNQQSLAHSRLWDAVVGFLHVFAHMQMKLSQDSSQIELLKELMDLLKDMVVMLLSMLEGNVVNGTIGKQMVDMLVESSGNVEMILTFFDMFLKLKDLVSSDAFKEYDPDGQGLISKKDFQKAMEGYKRYTASETEFLLSCAETNESKLLDYRVFVARFHEPAKDIGFNVAVLLTNLSEHMPHDARLRNFLELADSVLRYFQPHLGRIEIMGSGKRVERVYFEISESSRMQWEKPQVKESKRQFIFDIVNKGGEKEKMELFVNFCEDTIFEMQLAAQISASDRDEEMPGTEDNGTDEKKNEDKSSAMDNDDTGGEQKGFSSMEMMKRILLAPLCGLMMIICLFSIRNMKRQIKRISMKGLVLAVALFFQTVSSAIFRSVSGTVCFFLHFLYLVFLSGYIIEFAKETKLSDFFGDLPEPTLDEVTGVNDGVTHQVRGPKQTTASRGDLDAMTLDLSAVSRNPQLLTDIFGLQLRKEGGQYMLISQDSSASVVPSKYQVAVPEEEEDEEEEKHSETEKAEGEDNEKKHQRREDKEKRRFRRMSFHKAVEPEVQESATWKIIDSQKTKLLNYFARNFYNMRVLALCVAFSINFILLFYKVSSGQAESESPSDLSDDDDDYADSESVCYILGENGYMKSVLRFLAVLHTLISFCSIIGYYCLKVPLVVFKREKELARKLEFDGLYVTQQPADDDIRGQWDRLAINTPSFPNNYWDKFVKRKVMAKYSELYGSERISELLGLDKTTLDFSYEARKGRRAARELLNSIDMKYQIWKLGVVFTDNSFLYLAWYMLLSVLGHYNNFFFAAHLLDVAMGFKTLRTILSSVTHNGKQLVLTVGLLAVVVYLYTVVAFNFFRKFYNKSEDGQTPDMKCDDMLTCYLFHMYVGVRAGGGIGDEIEDPAGDESEFYRVVFDITFFFFVIVILLAIIQGLIIDAFGELRDQQEQVKEDMETKCFICGIGSEYFDAVPHGFESHTLHEHNLANYLFFVQYLINKDVTEHTGQESYVWKMYQERCWEFFPAGDCFRKQYEDQLG
ncbi:ryanodine receptor 2 isoform X2 [Hemibagrus wyckioides]|uniref:ryanodine receptor 2 isoform X2 n=1 Tax=Hemibagrus wyckioides TaxID=337641 RepID=UPI00266B8515|nr:ryanodine receptor 2 isoform X2 [Hemibagrus wyckioides]